jgi:hypothetical protein
MPTRLSRALGVREMPTASRKCAFRLPRVGAAPVALHRRDRSAYVRLLGYEVRDSLDHRDAAPTCRWGHHKACDLVEMYV